MLLAYLKPLFIKVKFWNLKFMFEFAGVMRMCFDFFEGKALRRARGITFAPRADEGIEL